MARSWAARGATQGLGIPHPSFSGALWPLWGDSYTHFTEAAVGPQRGEGGGKAEKQEAKAGEVSA